MVSFNRCTYTEKDLILAVKKSLSIAQVLHKLNLVTAGGNYISVNQKIKEVKLDISHFTGQGWNTGKRFRTIKPAEPLKTILVNNRYFSTTHLKNRLLKEKIKEYKCEKCTRTKWNDIPIALELDHIDGRRDNNQLKNLQLLCPNCHTQTSTYRRKNIRGSDGIGRQRSLKRNGVDARVGSSPTCRTKNKCISCSKACSMRARRCKSCAAFRRSKTKISWPSIHQLIEMIKQTSYLQTGKQLGVSDNAVRKHIRKRQ